MGRKRASTRANPAPLSPAISPPPPPVPAPVRHTRKELAPSSQISSPLSQASPSVAAWRVPSEATLLAPDSNPLSQEGHDFGHVAVDAIGRGHIDLSASVDGDNNPKENDGALFAQYGVENSISNTTVCGPVGDAALSDLPGNDSHPLPVLSTIGDLSLQIDESEPALDVSVNRKLVDCIDNASQLSNNRSGVAAVSNYGVADVNSSDGLNNPCANQLNVESDPTTNVPQIQIQNNGSVHPAIDLFVELSGPTTDMALQDYLNRPGPCSPVAEDKAFPPLSGAPNPRVQPVGGKGGDRVQITKRTFKPSVPGKRTNPSSTGTRAEFGGTSVTGWVSPRTEVASVAAQTGSIDITRNDAQRI